MGFPPMATDATAGILGKVYSVLPGVPTRLRAPKQLVRSRQRLGWGGGLVAKGGFVGGSCTLCNRAGVQGAPGERLGRESADAGLVLALGFMLGFLAPTVKRTTGEKSRG